MTAGTSAGACRFCPSWHGKQQVYIQGEAIYALINPIVFRHFGVDFTDHAQALSTDGEHRAAAGMVTVFLGRSGDVIIRNGELFQKLFRHALDGEEICVVAVHANHQGRLFNRQFVLRCGDVFAGQLEEARGLVAVVVVAERTSNMDGSATVRMMLVSSPSGLEITMDLRSGLSAGIRILS